MSKPKNDKPVVEDVVETVENIVAEVKKPKTYTVVDGDSYPSVADKFKPAGMSKHEYAKALFAKNKGVALSVGTVVVL